MLRVLDLAILARVLVKAEEDVAAVRERRRSDAQMQFRYDEAASLAAVPSPGDNDNYFSHI